ncbi:unnamed protein product [Jaminaea pallidilutea]
MSDLASSSHPTFFFFCSRVFLCTTACLLCREIDRRLLSQSLRFAAILPPHPPSPFARLVYASLPARAPDAFTRGSMDASRRLDVAFASDSGNPPSRHITSSHLRKRTEASTSPASTRLVVPASPTVASTSGKPISKQEQRYAQVGTSRASGVKCSANASSRDFVLCHHRRCNPASGHRAWHFVPLSLVVRGTKHLSTSQNRRTQVRTKGSRGYRGPPQL